MDDPGTDLRLSIRMTSQQNCQDLPICIGNLVARAISVEHHLEVLDCVAFSGELEVSDHDLF